MSEPDMLQEEKNHGYDPRELFAKGFDLGTVDLIQGGTFSEVVGRTVSSLLMHLKGTDGKSPFSGVSVILPPATATTLNDVAVFDALIAGTQFLRGSVPSATELELLKRIVRVLNCPTLDTADLEASILKEGGRRLVAVASGGLYRDLSVESPSAFGISAVLTSEDLWVPHVASLCRRSVAAVKGMVGYAVIHVEESPATQQHNIDQLLAVEDCYVCCLELDHDERREVDLCAPRWLALALGGEVSVAIAEIESLQLSEVNRYHVLAQLFSRAEMHEEAIATITQLHAHVSVIEASSLVQLAWLAHKSGDNALALKFLPEDAESVSSVIWIEQGLELATATANTHLIERYDTRLAQIHPGSGCLRENRDRRLLWNCSSKTEEEGKTFTTAGFTEKHLEIMSTVMSQQTSYDELLERARDWGADWLELATICCSMHAWSLGQSRYAADLASQITTSDLYGRQATQVVLWSVRSLMLKEQVRREEQDYYRFPLIATIRFLAVHPGDGGIRSQISRLLSVDSCGDVGIPAVATTMLDIAEAGVRLASSDGETIISPGAEGHRVEPDYQEIKVCIEKGLQWLADRGSAEYGVTVLPAELVPHPDETIDLLVRLILMSSPRGEDVDLKTLENFALLVCAMTPHATGKQNEDLRAMRLVAGHCATAGQFQRARNLAEQILVMGQGSALRQRLAWLGFADTYHRCRNMVEALVGLACALATDAPISKADLWQEIHTLIRVLRDLGLFQMARSFLPILKKLMSDLGLDADADLRVVAIEMSFRLMEVGGNQSEEIAAIVSELSLACERAMADRSLLLPLVVMLGQAVRRARDAALQVDERTVEVLNSGLALVGRQAAQLIEAVSADVPSASDVAALFNQVQRALYSSDAIGDFEIVGVAARRLLNDQEGHPASAEEKALAVELLADHAIALPMAPPVMQVEWPINYAKSLNNEGLDVVFLGLDSAGELVVTHVSNGHVEPIQQPRSERSFRLRMLAWLEDYPRQYGYVDAADGDDEFFMTMEALDVRLPAPESLLVIAEPLMQQLTVNLGLITPEDGGFPYLLGTRTAVGMMPSLTWLSLVRASARSERAAYRAWISPDEGPEANGTLVRALERLGGTFEDFGFKVDTGRQLPPDMSDAKLAVIAAHGGLTTEGRYIHSIRDEGSFFEAPTALATALAGVEVVILFVCSGGRIDKHPWGNTTVGLPKLLLDKGCRVVIASPWPLDVKVTYNWLEPFLLEWDAGSTVLQATKSANETVARRLGDRPQYSLGMTAYGDVLLTK